MSRLREYNLEEKISSIKSTLDELGRNSSRDLGSLDSSRNPSLLRRLDSVSSFNSERSIDVFLNQQREHDSRRIDSPPLPYVPEKTIDYSYNEEDRPLASQKWGGTLTNSFLRRTNASEECLVNTLPPRSAVQSPSLPQIAPLSDRAKDEMIDNLTQLQSELYMKLEQCQRQLDYAKNCAMEQETQAQLRLEELEHALEEARVDHSRHEGYGQSLAIKLQERDTQLADLTRRCQLLEDRLRQSDERNRTLEDRLRVLEDRCRTSDEEQRRAAERLKNALRENEDLGSDVRKLRENLANSEAAKETLKGESQRYMSEVSALRESAAKLESIISDLQQETDQIPHLSAIIARKEEDLNRVCEEKHLLEQRYQDVKMLLKQHDDVANKAFEIRFRESEDRINESWRRKTITLEQKIVDLTTELENMQMELSSRPTAKQLKDLQCTISQLEEKAEKETIRKQRRNGSMSVTPTRFRERTDQNLLKRLMDELKEANISDVLPRVRELLKAQKAGSSAELLAEKLKKLVRECSPADTFQGPESPSAKQAWKWIRRVVEDLMRLRRNDSSELLARITSALGASTPAEAYEKAVKLKPEQPAPEQ